MLRELHRRIATQIARLTGSPSRCPARRLDGVCIVLQIAYMNKTASITVRVPQALKRRLAQRAKREHRSISAQVLLELERAVASDDAESRDVRPALGLFEGSRVPTDDDFREVRAGLWGNMGHRDA